MAFFHELGHCLSNELVLKRESVMTRLSGEELAWELGLGLAFTHGYTWDYNSKEMKYTRKCFMTHFQSDATKLDIKEWRKEQCLNL